MKKSLLFTVVLLLPALRAPLNSSASGAETAVPTIAASGGRRCRRNYLSVFPRREVECTT